MRLLYSMLREVLPSAPPPARLPELLEGLGIEVEEAKDLSEGLRGKLALGLVRELEERDGLRVLRVAAAGTQLTLVTTSPVEAGDWVVVALPGAVLPGGRTVEKKKIRGILSEGMALSEEELGLSEKSAEIIRIGEPGSQDPLELLELDDWVYDLYIVPNRGDLLGTLGIAWELAPRVGERPRLPEFELGEDPEVEPVPVELRAEACPRYVARVVRNINNRESPLWLRRRLMKLGQRPINLATDASNYVLFYLGHPTHVFDLSKIKNKIIVREAEDRERIVLLDGTELELEAGTLLICDEREPLALAGVMGGAESGTTEKTRDVLIESAWFHPPTVRRWASRYGLMTESSRRFERGVDPEGPPLASRMVAHILQAWGGGRVGPALDARSGLPEPKLVRVSLARLSSLAGMELDRERARTHLSLLGFDVQDGDEWLLRVPSRRLDISMDQDVLEELIKYQGYDKVPSRMRSSGPFVGRANRNQYDLAARVLAGAGLYECLSTGFLSPRELELWGFPPEQAVPIKNPLGEDFSVMRPSLLPGLTRALATNLNRGREGVMLFEVGRAFRWLGPEALPEERQRLGIVLGGRPRPHYLAAGEMGPHDLKGILELLARWLGLPLEVRAGDPAWARPGSGGRVFLAGREVGWVGEIRPSILRFYELDRRAWAGELELPQPAERRHKPVPKHPGSWFDLSVLLPEGTPYRELREALVRVPYLESVALIDVYAGKAIPKGWVSYTVRLYLRKPGATLAPAELEEAMARAKTAISDRGWRLRG